MRYKRIDWPRPLTRWQRIKRWWREWEIELYPIPADYRTRSMIWLSLVNWRDYSCTFMVLTASEWMQLLPVLHDTEIRYMCYPHGPPMYVEISRPQGLYTEVFYLPTQCLHELIDLLSA